MNHIYRSIWNDSTATYVAAAETSKSGGKKASSSTGSPQAGRWALKTLAASLWLAYAGGASALPQGGVVAAGSASVAATPGKVTIVQGSQSIVLNWQGFGVGVGEAVQFVQPNASAVALNRVVGTDPSAILGSLSANGKVFLVNPHGILFGKGASANVGGLVASTLDITNADFMAGRYRFAGNSSNAVSNQGTIDAPGGYVALLGAHVSNDGVIAARMGSVALAGGQAITLDVAGDGLLNITIDQGAVNALVRNGGLIQADGGQVLLTAQAAGKLLDTVVNNTGVIQAQTLVNHNGTIKLLGDMQTGTANAAGTLDASAPTGGNGGFVETSAAHVKIDNALKVTTAAAHGLTGSWLIDPTDYTIAATGGDQTGAFFSDALKNSNVQIQSISGGSGVLGNINVNDTISWSVHQLKLTAQNNININKAMRGSGTASLALEYGQSAVASGNAATYNVKAEVDLPSGNNFSTRLGNDGTAVNYTVIDSLGAAGSTSGTDLQGIRGAVTAKFVLGANIDARTTSSWNGGLGFTPIGTTGIPFSGQFDGLGHVITGLNSFTTTSAGLAGLFGSNVGNIRNIGLIAPVIGSNIAGSQGNIAALAAINIGTIGNSYARGGSVTVTTGAIGGGLVALNSGTISDSHNSSRVSVTGNYDFWLGGLVGNTTKTSTIINSYNSGEVVGAYTAGGLTGNNLGSITNSFNSGSVTGTSNTGGLTSYNRGTGVITSSFNTGAVTSNSLTGGLVGSNVASGQIINSYSTGEVSSRSGTGSGFGGLAGGNSGLIRNSYATGAVTGVTAVGGLIGSNTSAGLTENAYSSGAVSLSSGGSGNLGGLIGSIAAGTSPSITGGYYNKTVNPGLQGVGTNGGLTTPSITGLTSAEMQVGSNFSAFAFTTITGATGNNWVKVNTDGSLNGAGNATGATGPMLASEYNTTIASAHQLQLMAMNLAGNYTLKQDIDAASTGTAHDVWNGSTFVPVGSNPSAPFTGTFDGAGHVVSGLVINRPGTDYAGLFGATSGIAIVRNVGLEGGSVTGSNSTGALVGLNQGLVDGSYSTASVTGGSQVGGLIGMNDSGGATGIISNSYASGPVTGTVIVGGLVGSNSGTLTNNHATGTVTGFSTPGGLAGTDSGTSTGNFWDITTSGTSTSATGTGLTTAQMKWRSTYTAPGWDLAGTWIVYDTNTYPLLRAFMTPLQVTFASNASKTYDGTNSWTAPVATFSNPNAVLQGSLNYGAAGGAVNAGTYAITAEGLYSGQRGYAIGYNTATLTIDPKAVTLTGATVNTRAYDGTTAATLSGGSLGGVLSQDAFDITFTTGTFDTRNAGTGKTVTALATGSAGGNYSITANGLTGTITPKALALGGMTALDKVYDGNTKASLSGGTLSGLVGSESLGFSGQSGVFSDTNAASGKAVTVTGLALADAGSGATAGLASNYSVGNPNGLTASIAQKALTITGATAANRVYDGTTAVTVSGGALGGMVGSETIGLGSLSGELIDKNAGNGKTVNVVGATLADGSNGGLASNYTVASPSGLTANITRATIGSVSNIVADSKVYDANTKATVSASGATFNGMVGGDSLAFSATNASFADKNAGTKAVTVTGIALGGADAANYNLSSTAGSGTGTITRKAVTITGMTAVNKVYDGNTKASVTGGAISGTVGSETLGATGLVATFSDKNVGTGKTVTSTGTTLVNGTGGGLANNYTVTNPVFTANITRKALTVSGMTAGTKVYDATTAATLSGGALSGLISGETLVLGGGTGVFGDKNVGTAKVVTVTGVTIADGTGSASNYTVTNPTSVTGSITRKAVTITGMTAVDKVYDGSTRASVTGGAISGTVGAETLGATGLVATFDDKNAGTGKTVTSSGTTLVNGSNGGLASNYSITNPVFTADITPKALTVTGTTADTKVYDATTAAALSGGTLTGLVSGETLVLGGSTGVFADANAGSNKAVIVSGSALADGTGLARNYTVTNPSTVSGSITQKALTVVGMTAGNKAYDGTQAALLSGGMLAGLAGGETMGFSGSTGAFDTANAGTAKTVTVSGTGLVNGTGLAGNYTVSDPAGLTADVAPKTLTIAGMTAGSKVYDGNAVAALSGGTLTGLVGSETLGLSGSTGAFDTANAGIGKAVTVTGAALVDAGSGATAGLAGNYSVGNPTGLMADVTPKALTVAGVSAGNKVYDGNVVAVLSGGSLVGLAGGETLGLVGLAGAFSDKNAANGKAVTLTGASLVDGTGLASNYTVSNPAGLTANIGKATIASVGGITAGSKVYDGNAVASVDVTGATFSGMVAGDNLSASAAAGVFADKNAATGKAVSVSGIALGGTDAGNYSLASSTASTTADITPKALTIEGMTAGNKVFDGTSVASLIGGTLTGLVGNETLGLSGSSGAFDTASVGNGKAVTVSGSSLFDGSGLAGNYSVSNPIGLTADITTPAVVAVTVPANRPTAGNVDAAVGVNSSPFAESGVRSDASGTREVRSDGKKGPVVQTGAGVPPGLVTLGFTMTGNGIRLPAGVVPASKNGDN